MHQTTTEGSQTANKQIRGVTVTKGSDPNNVYPIEEAFIKEVLSRFENVRGVVRRTVGYENDALQLSQDAQRPTDSRELFSNADPREIFDFPTTAGKKREFIRQLKEWLLEEVLEITDPVAIKDGQHWTAEYIRNAYVQGIQTAQGRLMQEGLSLTPSSADEILGRPVNIQALQSLYTRAFENLRGITDDMADDVRTTLSRGFVEGWHPRKMADELTSEMRDMERTRAVTLARTETINAATNAQLNEYEDFGVEGVAHVGRMDAGDERVCPFCRGIDDVLFTTQEFQNKVVRWGSQVMRLGIPSHPNGRCTVMPRPGIQDGLPPLADRLPDTIRGKSVELIN